MWTALGALVESASAGADQGRSPDLVIGAAERGRQPSGPAPVAPDSSPSRAQVEIPRLSPDPGKLRRAKARAAEDLASDFGRSPRLLSPLPKATVFGGLNKPGMAAEGDTTPPDTTGAIGPTHYVEFVNGTGITAYDRNLNAVSGPVALEDFIGFPFDAVFDPQIQWDDNWGRWIYVMDDIEGPEDNYLAFGWSKTADPTNLSTGPAGGWCGYFLFTGEFFDDYPKLGHSDAGITIGTNVFTSVFVGSRIWSIAKPANPQTCPELEEADVEAFGPLETEDGDTAFTPVPANTADSSANSYVVAADSPFFTTDDEIMAWHVSGAGEGATLVEDGNMSVGAIAFPANVPQEGTTELLDSLDARLTNAVAVTDPAVGEEAVWTQHTVDGPGGRSVVRWYELLPDAQTVRQEGTISDPSHFVFNGAISPTAQGDSAAIDFNRGSVTLFPEMHAQSRDSGTPLDQMEGDVLLGTSAGVAQDFSCNIAGGEPCRWGDYAGASPDPSVPGIVWGSNQGLAAPLAPPDAEDARWTTRNFALVAELHTTIDSGPPNPTNDNTPTFTFSSNAGGPTFECKLDGGSFGSCGSPFTTSTLSDGAHTFQVQATDAGNTDPTPASWTFTVDTTAPTADLSLVAPPPPSAAPKPGIASAANLALVQGGKALLRMSCPGPGPCQGTVRLVVQVKSGKRAKRSASAARVRSLVIGRAKFSIADGKNATVRVPLTSAGLSRVRKAGKRGLPVKLRGSGVVARALKLKLAPSRRK